MRLCFFYDDATLLLCFGVRTFAMFVYCTRAMAEQELEALYVCMYSNARSCTATTGKGNATNTNTVVIRSRANRCRNSYHGLLDSGNADSVI